MNSLLFIYNAESGIASALLDTGHRFLSPRNYPCPLCMVTYGPFGMKSNWKKFIATLPYSVTFLHKNELPANLQKELKDFPCLVLQTAKGNSLLISAEEFKNIKDLDSLQQKVTSTLQTHRSETY